MNIKSKISVINYYEVTRNKWYKQHIKQTSIHN
jgi:hypothetical protein